MNPDVRRPQRGPAPPGPSRDWRPRPALSPYDLLVRLAFGCYRRGEQAFHRWLWKLAALAGAGLAASLGDWWVHGEKAAILQEKTWAAVLEAEQSWVDR